MIISSQGAIQDTGMVTCFFESTIDISELFGNKDVKCLYSYALIDIFVLFVC